jgi:ACS family tartrate transporter-like MFS transporter
MASFGGLVGPSAVGIMRDLTGSFAGGLVFLAVLLILAAGATLLLRGARALGEPPPKV